MGAQPPHTPVGDTDDENDEYWTHREQSRQKETAPPLAFLRHERDGVVTKKLLLLPNS